MAKIIKRKDNHLVERCLGDSETINLTSNGCSWTHNGINAYSQDLTTNDHEIITGVTAPTRFFAGFFYYDTDWSLDTDALNEHNTMANEVPSISPIVAEL
jgi:hypothetical protein